MALNFPCTSEQHSRLGRFATRMRLPQLCATRAVEEGYSHSVPYTACSVRRCAKGSRSVLKQCNKIKEEAHG